MTRGPPVFVLTDFALLVLVLLALLILGQWDLPLLCLTSSPLPCLHDHFEHARLVEIGTEKNTFIAKTQPRFSHFPLVPASGTSWWQLLDISLSAGKISLSF